jgi:UDP-N-acetyl-2-amino-2-deoxyglucuronate dehydrogenase
MKKNFALIGAAGFVAPRHMQAIKATGNYLLAALDKFDSVGVIDSYFPEADFFVEFERFDRHLEKIKRQGTPLHYVSVCSPNYLHDAHIRFGLRHGADVICEKPVVLNPWNIAPLQEIEQETGHRVYNILQLRLHERIMQLKQRVVQSPADQKYDIDLAYISARGKWYHISWKGDASKSGGIATNIGVHFFDMLLWIFGSVQQNIVHVHTQDCAAGYLELERARVRWFLSIDAADLPPAVKAQGGTTYRALHIEGEDYNFSEGFTDLHTRSYAEIMREQGFGLEETKAVIQLVHDIRNQAPIGISGDYHPLLKV